MAVSAVSAISPSNILQVLFTQGYNSQFSTASPAWEMMKKIKVKDTGARTINYFMYLDPGYAAAQSQPVGTDGADFPVGQVSGSQENTAVLKLQQATVQISRQLVERAAAGPAYAKPLEVEIRNKAIVMARIRAMQVMHDGTGVIGEINGAPTDTTGANGYVTVTISNATASRGSIGCFQPSDILKAYTQAGAAATAPTVAGGTFYGWKVLSRNRRADTAVLAPVTSNGTRLTLTASALATTNVFYRIGQATIPNLTSIGTADYGTLTEVLVGLESLSANDGRVVNGVTMSGSTGGTRLACGGAAPTLGNIGAVLDDAEMETGSGVFKYSRIITSPEGYEQILALNETDVRLQMASDERGASALTYVHQSGETASKLKLVKEEFAAKRRMFLMPDSRTEDGHQVLEYYGTDVTAVKAGSQQLFLKPGSSAGGYADALQCFTETRGVIVGNRAAALATITDFALPS